MADGHYDRVETAIHGNGGAGFGADAYPVAIVDCAGKNGLADPADIEVVGGVGRQAGKGVGVAGADRGRVVEYGQGFRSFEGSGQFEAQGTGSGGIPADGDGVVFDGQHGETGGFGAAGHGRGMFAGRNGRQMDE